MPALSGFKEAHHGRLDNSDMVFTFMGPLLRQILPASTAHTMQSASNTSLLTESLPGLSMQSGTHSPQPPALGMTPASRYNHNLKVMRWRDPSILSIIDQFSHVCVYHHNGSNWEKHGVEGSMFLFERNSYPPYGLYVMNRTGKADYVKHLYPEDEVVPSEKFLIIRSYPDFREARLTKLSSLYPGKDLDKFSDVYAVPNLDEIDPKSKGHRTITGLWTFEDNSRDSLVEVMPRLHSYIRQNKPYPEEFRYGPGRPPPPNRLRAIPKKTAGSTSDSQVQMIQSDSENERSYYSDAPNLVNRGALSDVDKLFLKLGPTPGLSPREGNYIAQSEAPKPVSSTTAMTPRGNALLDQIFASASTPTLLSAPTNATAATSNTKRQSTTLFSPQPSIGTPGPQVLNSQVLTSILTGSAPSRASSVVSHPSSREGDNEGGSDSPSTVLDEDSDYQKVHLAKKKSPRINADLRNGNPTRLGQRVNGDVTPRLQLNGLQRTSSVAETSSTSTTRPTNHLNPPAPFSVRDASFNPMNPDFESDSDLWPSSQPSTTTTDDDDASDIVELNFEDTSLLSDPNFTRVVKQRKSAVMLRQTDAPNGVLRPLNGNGNSSVSSEKVKGKSKRKRSKKEDIEKGRDMPPISPSTTRGLGMDRVVENGSTSRSSSSTFAHQKSAEMKTPTMSGTMLLHKNGSVSSFKSKGNGHKTEALNGNGVACVFDPDAVSLSMAQVLNGHKQLVSSDSKTEFMQQVLNLLQNDESFSDKLFTDYIARA